MFVLNRFPAISFHVEVSTRRNGTYENTSSRISSSGSLPRSGMCVGRDISDLREIERAERRILNNIAAIKRPSSRTFPPNAHLPSRKRHCTGKILVA